jgi:aryl-alcohol dehydrogenase-like predicted oxidoreductase
MNGRPTAAAAGKIDVGGDLTVNRLGFGAMRITGTGIWGDPPDRDRAKEALRPPEHVEENVTAASIELTAEEIRAITLAVLSR